ncbi:MAG: arabinose efflux permease family protein [Anaerocolumna sp.]|nr:arabinose efflux permease family protein [Anaerocolumna sp.]
MKEKLLAKKSVSSRLVFLLAVACGLIVANLYYAQPLVGAISKTTGIPIDMAGLIVTMTQIGYVFGLIFIVPLSDLIENKKLVVTVLLIATVGLIVAVISHNLVTYFTAAVMIGVGSVGAQILVPYAASLASKEERGRMVGNVMSGLLLGIMFARPVASLLTDIFNWQFVFALSAVLMVILSIVLAALLPKKMPETKDGYRDIVKSLFLLFKTKPVLRRRSLYQASLFGAFSLFWTVVPLWLTKHFQLSQKEVALFALAGVAGAVAAPIAGRLADRGLTRKLTGAAFFIAIFSFAITLVFKGTNFLSLIIFCLGAVMLDMAVSGNLVLGQQAIYALGDEIRGRVNGCFMAVFFTGGAVGSALGGLAYAKGSWQLAAILGMSMPIVALLYFLTEKHMEHKN